MHFNLGKKEKTTHEVQNVAHTVLKNLEDLWIR